MSQISASSYFSSDPRATIKEKPLVFWARIGNCKPMALIWNAVCYKKKEGIYANIRITKFLFFIFFIFILYTIIYMCIFLYASFFG